MPTGLDLQRLRDEVDAARLQLAAAVGALEAWEAGAAHPNEAIMIGELDGAERSVVRAQALLVRLLDRRTQGLRPAREASPSGRILERWRQRLARGQEAEPSRP